jgi:hypothetical protein
VFGRPVAGSPFSGDSQKWKNRLLLYPKNAVLCCLSDSEFDDGLGWNLDLLLGLGIEARARFPLLLYELAEAWQDEFAVLFDLFVCERAERREEYAGGSFVGLGCSRQCDLKFSLGHVLAVAYGSGRPLFQENRSRQLLAPSDPKSPIPLKNQDQKDRGSSDSSAIS